MLCSRKSVNVGAAWQAMQLPVPPAVACSGVSGRFVGSAKNSLKPSSSSGPKANAWFG